MAVKRKRKKILKLSKKMQKKLIVIFLFVVILLIGLIVRLMYIQKTSGKKYEKIVLNQQGYDSQNIPFKRGDIVDSKGTILATSEDVYNVILDCKLINEEKKYIEPTIAAVIQCFPDVTEDELRTLLKDRSESQYCVLRKKLPYKNIQGFKELQDQVYTEGKEKGKKVNPNVTGVWFEKEYKRTYPFDTKASKVLGFTTSGNVGIGIGGLEEFYNDTLNGINGRQFGYFNSDSNFESTIKEAVNGNSIVTTLDMNVQEVVERKISEFNEAHRNEFTEGPGAKNIGVLVMDVNTGGILAMADNKGYSLNDPWNLSNYYTDEEVAAMDEDTKLNKLNGIWQNFCITYRFEPGSTVKPLTVATGLDTGKLTGDETYVCDGVESVGGREIHCANRSGHGTETVEQAIMNSCNDALMQMARVIGMEDFTKYQNIFNIGLKTNIDLTGEARTDTLIYTLDNMGPVDLATNSFGQSYNVTMIQVASAIASVINGGFYYQPHLVKKVVDDNGNTVQNVEPIVVKQTVSKETSDTIRDYMYSTVTNGTAQSAKVEGYSMGGKTGTAQKRPVEEKKYLVSFVGFTPADQPEVLIYVVIDEPNVEKQAQSSSLATNFAKEILTEILPYMNIFPDEGVEVQQEQGEAVPIEENYEGDIFD